MSKVDSRKKGHGFERDVCKLLNKTFKLTNTKFKFKRVPMSGGFDKQNFPGDIFSTHPHLDLAKLTSIECKFYKDWKLEDLINGNKPKIWDWWIQACNDAKIGDKFPLLLFKKNNSKIYFMMRRGNCFSMLSRVDHFVIHDQTDDGKGEELVIGMFEPLLKNLEIYEANKE